VNPVETSLAVDYTRTENFLTERILMSMSASISWFSGPIALAIVAALSHSVQALDFQSQIDPLAKALIEDDNAVGFVVGIYKGGDTQIIAYGETKKGSGAAPDGETIYEIGSVSKAFTGVLLADMVERGAVRLDDPVQKYLPAAIKMPMHGKTPITLEHLATHTSGLPRLPDNLKPADPTNPYADYTGRLLYAFLKDHKLRREPGEYEYSNYGMGLLGFLLARSERTTYEKLLIERIAEPCGMDDTCIKLSKEQQERLAPPYDASLSPDKNWDTPTLAGAGAVRSTANDMLKFIKANLAKDDTPLTKALRLSHEKRRSAAGAGSIGLGWHIAGDGGMYWHNGMTGGYASWLSVVPAHDFGVVVLSNTATDKITELGTQISRIAFGQKVEAPKRLAVAKVDSELLKAYEGVYRITPQFAITVTLEDGKLMVQATDQQKLQVFPESKTKFFLKVVDAQITFESAEDDGKASYLILHQNGANQVAMRQE
jgi:serine-type D-Ala-D-Ala carboxypeptidase/endopeptidase